jgi:hypothetical protein
MSSQTCCGAQALALKRCHGSVAMVVAVTAFVPSAVSIITMMIVVVVAVAWLSDHAGRSECDQPHQEAALYDALCICHENSRAVDGRSISTLQATSSPLHCHHLCRPYAYSAMVSVTGTPENGRVLRPVGLAFRHERGTSNVIKRYRRMSRPDITLCKGDLYEYLDCDH